MNFDIKGNSGCSIDIIEKDNKLFVKKSTQDPNYRKRLNLQGHKQASDELADRCGIRTPIIHELEWSPDESSILMDYIYSKNFIDYFESASKQDIDNLVEKLTAYIDKEFEHSIYKEISTKIFIEKIESVFSKCNSDEYSELKNSILDVFENIKGLIVFPIGTCHGDLTFSNILFASDGVYFIDYLDSFIETPLQDIVKLRQDTKYGWSCLKTDRKFDNIRMQMILKYIDDKLDNHFQENCFYRKWYSVIQLINILRILPYSKEEKVKNFVISTLKEILEELKS